MSWNGSGTYTKLYSWVTREAIPEDILAVRFDEQESDIEAGINACITKNGESKPTADLSPNADNSYSLGTTALRWVTNFLKAGLNFRSATATNSTLLSAVDNGTASDVNLQLPAEDAVLATRVGNTFTGNQIWSKGADVASAAALTPGADGNYFDVTGTDAITSIASGAPSPMFLQFDGVLVLTHADPALRLPGAGNIATEAGDTAIFVHDGSGSWTCVSFTKVTGEPVFSKFNAERQTVLDSDIDSNGLPDFVSIGAGLTCNLTATTTNTLINFANGFSINGVVDYIKRISADVSSYWSALTASATSYLYFDRNTSTGVVTAGAVANLPPVYGETYLGAMGVGRAYSSFDGVDAATTFSDANAGLTHTFGGTAQLDDAQAKFNTTSLLLDGNSDYDDITGLTVHAGENEGGFEMIAWIYHNAVGAAQVIFGSATTNHFQVLVNASDVLVLNLGDGATLTIANASAGSTALTAGKWYGVRLIWDGAAYKVYLSDDGATETTEISVTSAVAFAPEPSGFRLGADWPAIGSYFNGWIQDFSYAVGPQTAGTQTPSTDARGGLPADTEHWFNTSTMKMNYWDRATAAWIEVHRVFAGEAVTDASSVTSVVNYALRGRYNSGIFSVAADTAYSKNHNLGCAPLNTDVYTRENDAYKWGKIWYSVTDAVGGTVASDRLAAQTGFDTYVGSGGSPLEAKLNQQIFSATVASGQCKIEVSRGWQ